MKHTFTDPDLLALDKIWPIGQMLEVPEHGSIVVAGAYEGRYVHYLSEMFPKAFIVGYEPQRASYRIASNRLQGRAGIVFINAGLGTGDREVRMFNSETDGANIIREGGKLSRVVIKDAVNEIHSRLPRTVDLFVMNMEGSEWAVLPYLMDEMLHHRIRSFAIQFHPDYVSAERAFRVREQLSWYYHLIHNDYPSWTYWKRK